MTANWGFSFTQNLSSVLSDPKRPRSEVHSFFTRHWGDSFVPKIRVSSSSSLPSIDVDHFRNYLTTTAKVCPLALSIPCPFMMSTFGICGSLEQLANSGKVFDILSACWASWAVVINFDYLLSVGCVVAANWAESVSVVGDFLHFLRIYIWQLFELGYSL